MSNPNWHLTECGLAESDGASDKAPGLYPADELNAACCVAPGAYLDEWLVNHPGCDAFPGWRRDAVRAFRTELAFDDLVTQAAVAMPQLALARPLQQPDLGQRVGVAADLALQLVGLVEQVHRQQVVLQLARVYRHDRSLVGEFPGNPLYTSQVVEIDFARHAISWAGEQEAGDDLWDWLLTQGYTVRG